jgi:hypothetical protein
MTPRIEELASTWAHRLQELVDRLDVPGAVLGVSHRGQRVIAAAAPSLSPDKEPG